MKEEALARQVVEHLRVQGWDCYAEVEVDARCDIVARRPESGLVLAVECKDKLGWAVVKQAARWRSMANWSVVATPRYQRRDDERLACEMLTAMRLGWIGVGHHVDELVAPPLLRQEPGTLGNYLREEQRDWAAPGNARGERFTLFGKTRKDIEAFVRDHPHCTIEDILAGVKTHYRSAKSAKPQLVKLARLNVLGPVRTRFDGVRHRFYVDDDEVEVVVP